MLAFAIAPPLGTRALRQADAVSAIPEGIDRYGPSHANKCRAIREWSSRRRPVSMPTGCPSI
ncbi:hypothetical protein, partial [Methylorubrum rhodesianum]|uniref:hypothetical protein n=1 Tax=Methylorubrum rhodesianum TaxID=29427 RepID=UPI0037451925